MVQIPEMQAWWEGDRDLRAILAGSVSVAHRWAWIPTSGPRSAANGSVPSLSLAGGGGAGPQREGLRTEASCTDGPTRALRGLEGREYLEGHPAFPPHTFPGPWLLPLASQSHTGPWAAED